MVSLCARLSAAVAHRSPHQVNGSHPFALSPLPLSPSGADAAAVATLTPHQIDSIYHGTGGQQAPHGVEVSVVCGADQGRLLHHVAGQRRRGRGGITRKRGGGRYNIRQGGQSEAIRVWIISASSFITVLGGRGGARQGGITGRGRVGKEIPIWGEGSA